MSYKKQEGKAQAFIEKAKDEKGFVGRGWF